MQEMTAEERRAFLLSGHRTGKLATVRQDGRPHVTPVWFTLDGEVLVFTVWHATVKAANLRRDPRVAFCVDDDTPPFAYVIIEGSAVLDDHAPDLQRWTTAIAARYMGAGLADSFGKRNAVEGELLVRVTPSRILAYQGISD